ncbi:MAG TPA: DUF6049 family protein [Pseudonocardiaceae bacterium]|nr:DUF6049 family protein [Pseudonocardiaceae bacterium]
MTRPAARAVGAVLLATVAVLLMPPAGASAAPPPASTPQQWLRLSMGSPDPAVVTANTKSVTLTGRITNISDRAIDQITARLQVADPLSDGTDVRAALAPTATYTHGDTTFRPLARSLAPGRSTTFHVTEPVDGPDSLRITQSGVYPLMINLQGVPAFSTAYRLVVGTMLLPVLAPPGGVRPAPPGAPSRLTVLWPLVDQQPRMIGTANGRAVLSDDSLATSLAPGGRLYGLVDSVRQVGTANPQVLASLCFAVDPDLLDTVRAMSSGYRVRSGPGQTVAGRGAAAATDWLASLKNLTAGRCVLALPFADADVASLARAGGTNLLQLALSESSSVAAELGASELPDVAWPADGTLDTHTMTALAGLGVNTVLLDPASLSPTPGAGPVSLAGFTGAAAPKVVPLDPVAGAAMAPRTDEPTVVAPGLAAQNGLAATLYRTVLGDGSGEPTLIAPPRRWAPTEAQALAFLNGTATALNGHYATPTALSDAIGVVPTGHQATLRYPKTSAAAEVNHALALDAVATDSHERDMLDSMARDHTTPDPVLPAQLITPLRLDLLRAMSTAWRGGGPSGANAMLAVANAEFRDLAADVTVIQPNLPILLGSKDSRLPVTVSNKLPVDISVRVDLVGDPGLPAGSRVDVIPAGLSITVFIPTSVTRSGRFSAYATVRTLGGTQLGQQARLELVSSAYGTIIVIVTACAFGLLLLLSGRRIYRRAKASRAAGEAIQEPDQETVGALVGAGEPADRQDGERRGRNQR